MSVSALVPASNIMSQDGVDPRMDTLERYQSNGLDHFDPVDTKALNSLPLEVYEYYAAIEREREDNDTREVADSYYTQLFKKAIGKRHTINTGENELPMERVDESKNFERNAGEKHDEKKGAGATVSVITDSERHHAYRALRTASWQGVFFLITTDILGPSSAPYAISLTGWGGGIITYFFLWIAAMAAGQILYRLYMKLDSARFPVKCFADLGERLIGRWFRHVCNIIQSLQLLLNVALLVLGNGVTLAQLVKYKLCFSICNLIWALVGMAIGQIRSLKNFSILANWNIWLNVVVIIMTIVGDSIYDPVPTLNFPDLTPPYPAVTHSGFNPPGQGWYQQVSGVSIAVFAYGGAMIFVEFMAEMRRPRDFYKAAYIAQTFIFVCYLLFGLIVYGYQGQYSYIIPSLSIANYGYLLAVNIIGLITTIIAAMLYGNIGVKILYYNILQPYFKAPDVTASGKGRVFWTATVFFYWAFAFVFGSAIPNLSSMVTLVGAVCILQFTYTFPPLMWCVYLVQRDALLGDRPWEPGMAYLSNRVDTWRDASRWKRGFAKQVYIKAFLLLIFLASMAFCGLGAYSGVEGIITTFATAGAPTSFGCRAPGET